MLPILHQSLWRDEAFSFFVAEKSLKDIFLFVIHDAQGPFYYYVLHFWMIFFGNSEAMIRSLSIVSHLALGVLAFFFISYVTKNKTAGVFASFFTLFNPFLLAYSFEARPYSLVAFLIPLALYLYFRQKFIFSSIVFSLAILTHNFSLISLFGFFLYWAFTKRSHALKLFLAPALTVLIWGFFVLRQWQKTLEGFWIDPVTSGVFLQTFEKFFGGIVPFKEQDLLLTIVFILLGFVIAGWIPGEKTDREKEAGAFISVALAPIIVSYIVSLLWVPNFHERYVIASLPLFILFAAAALNRLPRLYGKTISYVLVGLLASYAIVSLQAAEHIVQTPTKSPINYAVNQILSKAQVGDIIVPKEYLNFLETKYYVRRAGSDIPVYTLSETGVVVWYVNGALTQPSEIIRKLPEHRRVWLVTPDGGYELVE